MQTMQFNHRAGWLCLAIILGATVPVVMAQQPASSPFPVYTKTNTPAPTTAPPAPAPVPPPTASAKRSAADLEKLVAPIALYPDPLLATLLPASVYPLEIVQAARFVADTNNLAKLDEQPWDENVKAVARVPEVIKLMDKDLTWTTELGEAFLAQDKDVMDAIQAMRGKAQKAGTLQTSSQQIVTVTNMVVEKTVEQQVVVVTNTIVQIQPASSSVVYVPTYNPYTVYYPPPAYYVNPYPLLTFGAGIAMGAIIANNCDWYRGGCYHGGSININGDVNINRGNINSGNRVNSGNRATAQKWQPDQSRLSKSGAPSVATPQARGYGSGGAATRSPTASTGAIGSRPSAGAPAAGARPAAGTRPSAGATPAARPSTPANVSRPSTPANVSRPSPSPNNARPAPSPSVNRSSGGSAFGGVGNGASSRSAGSRGAASRGGGGGGRGGGGRR